MEVIKYTPKGVCSRSMTFEVEGEIIKKVTVVGGCAGNLLGISKLLEGMNVHHVIERFDGVRCGFKNTSCPDQIAQALKEKFGN